MEEKKAGVREVIIEDKGRLVVGKGWCWGVEKGSLEGVVMIE